MSTLPNDQLNTKLAAYLPGALHYNFAFPWDQPGVHILSGVGHTITDTEGVEYLDFFSKFGAAILGHGNQRYASHIAQSLLNTATAVDHFGPREVSIVQRLLSAVPGAEQVRFSLSGTEAVLNALRLARAATGRQKIIRFIGHYHGSADPLLGGRMKGGDSPYEVVEMPGDPRGTQGRASDAFGGSLLLPWNDREALKEAVEQYKDEVAAMIMEPICINGGGLAPSAEYMTYLRSLANEHGILVIFDEVITGFRLGFGSAQVLVGIQPDIWVFGKAIAGGSLPVSCIMSSTKIMRMFTDKLVTHGGTFNGYPAGLYAIEATLDILEEDPAVYKKAIARSNIVRGALVKAAADNDVDLVLQGHPMAICFHACTSAIAEVSEWTVELKMKESIIREAFKQHRILLAPPCRMYPSVAINDDTVSAVVKQLDMIFKTVREEYDAQGFTR